MKTNPRYLTDPYKKSHISRILDVISYGENTYGLIFEETIFYPIGGGQPTDQGMITVRETKYEVREVVIKSGEINHFVITDNPPVVGEEVSMELDWKRRFKNMQIHSAGHVIDFALQKMGHVPKTLVPQKANHGSNPEIHYKGSLDITLLDSIQKEVDAIIENGVEFTWVFKTLDELEQIATYLQPGLPTNKPLRSLTLEGYGTVADGGTIVKNTNEIGHITINRINSSSGEVILSYSVDVEPVQDAPKKTEKKQDVSVNVGTLSETTQKFLAKVHELQSRANNEISAATNSESLQELKNIYLGRKSEFIQTIRSLGDIPKEERGIAGQTANTARNELEQLVQDRVKDMSATGSAMILDVTAPGKKITQGHLHLTTQAIKEITDIFKRLGFYRVRYPVMEWDYYAFGALNFPEDHPARDDWETFFIDKENIDEKYGKRLLSPHTSSGQIREMEMRKPPIRMINIAKVPRRQLDVSHALIHYQFEGLVIDKGITIKHLKGVLDHFVKEFFGEDRQVRIRPYNFRFTEPSFEVDISCGNCGGTGCRLCKEGWLEIGGAGMVHPKVLEAGGIDPKEYSGFAFGWGVERNKMMQKGIKIGDIRALYQNDIRFLKQF